MKNQMIKSILAIGFVSSLCLSALAEPGPGPGPGGPGPQPGPGAPGPRPGPGPGPGPGPFPGPGPMPENCTTFSNGLGFNDINLNAVIDDCISAPSTNAGECAGNARCD